MPLGGRRENLRRCPPRPAGRSPGHGPYPSPSRAVIQRTCQTKGASVRVALLSREFPPEVYGGAGVHLEYLSRELARLVDLEVHCFGGPRESGPFEVVAYQPWERLAGSAKHLAALRTVSTDLAIAAGVEGADLVHSHTWYANLAGHLAKLLYGIPHVVT